MKSRPVNPMSLMTDVFVELERLKISLEALRDRITVDDRKMYSEIWDAKHHCRNIIAELKCIASLLSGAEQSDFQKPDAPLPPKGTRPTLIKS